MVARSDQPQPFPPPERGVPVARVVSAQWPVLSGQCSVLSGRAVPLLELPFSPARLSPAAPTAGGSRPDSPFILALSSLFLKTKD